jgi:hypothetical protein
MQVIGAGVSKTGTMSLQCALNKLGFPCYHFADTLVNYARGDLDMWNNYMEGKSEMDWHKLFSGYEAVMDVPSYLYVPEIMKAFPDAKVILSVRDPEKWYVSFVDTIEKHNANVIPLMFLPSFKAFQRAFQNAVKFVFGGDEINKENALEFFNSHNEKIKSLVPPDRLLIFNVKDGWEPLCEFLNVPVPNEPFPWANVAFADAEKIFKKVFIRDLLKFSLPYVAVVVLVIVLLIVLFR